MQRLVDGVGDLIRVEGVDQERARAQSLRRTRELRQDEHAAIAPLARNEFESHLRHAFAKGRNERNLREKAQRTHVASRDGLVEVMDRRMLERAKPAVDTPDELVHLVAQLLVARCVAARRRGDLNELYAVGPLRVILEELLERDELVRDTLDIVHSVDTQQQLLAVEAPLQLDDLVLELGALEHGLKLGDVNASRESIDGDSRAGEGIEDIRGLNIDIGAQDA
mmetsp:Transcript_1829/g.4135  ORF Transcript_1829/g.4135 Transcript_1829/m.4135 type:complete len:224 (-) Transcript_1829:1537-2208(-)